MQHALRTATVSTAVVAGPATTTMLVANSSLASASNGSLFQQTCSDRGGCSCDCSWASANTCKQDDGSCCWGCCCSGHSPSPGPSPSPSPSSDAVGIFFEAGGWKCLDLPGGSTANGNKLWLWDCNGKDNQKWVFAPGSWKIAYAGDPSKCIDVIGGGTENGQQLQIWDCNGHNNQVWGYDTTAHTIFLAKSQTDATMCMDLRGGDVTNGNAVDIWHCNGLKNQKWVFHGPAPGPSPPGPSPPAPSSGAKYCPNPATDFVADYGSPQWSSSGWTIHGGARASSKASFNLAGGFVEFDMDLSGAHGGVNNNFYVTFPSTVGQYCDSGGTGGCAELDFVENNGNCAAATTFHTDPNGGDKDGKQTVNSIGKTVHVHAAWDQSGDTLTVTVDGHTISGAGNPGNEMRTRGAVMYSSQWTGWVPGHCEGDGNLGASTFSVSNLKITGAVVQGPEPRKCGAADAEGTSTDLVVIV